MCGGQCKGGMLDRFVAPATSAWPGSAEEGMHVERRCAGVGSAKGNAERRRSAVRWLAVTLSAGAMNDKLSGTLDRRLTAELTRY